MSKHIDAEWLLNKYKGHHDFYLNAWDGDFKSMDAKDKARCDELNGCIADIFNAPSIDIDLADDGTLSVYVDDATKVTRVLVEDGKSGDLYYTDRPQEWIPCSERLPDEDGHYIVYAPSYRGGSSSGKEIHNGVMFSRFKSGKWSIEVGYHKRPNCVKAWMPIEPWEGADDERGR